MKKRLVSTAKVICRGNARRFGLRPSGRRNALGTILTKRVCKWASGCSPAMALVFRCNTHTAPNFRVPLTHETHDKECKADCLGKDKARLLTAITYRAQRSSAGYFAGYMSKRQGVGRFELAQANKNLAWLKDKLQGKSNAHQYHTVANRALGDLEFRGCARPITEEFNLAGNYNKNDVLQAEFYRTSNFEQFLGGNILRLLRSQKKQSSPESTQCTFFRKRIGYVKKKEGFEVPWEQRYGFRGAHPAFYYLSPWEFVQWWFLDRLRPPTTDNRTQWTEAGLAYKALHVGNKDAPAPRAGEHYIVRECMDSNSKRF